MKTVRTRVKSALKRNSKGTPAPPSVPVKLPAASTSDPSILLSEKVSGTRAPPTSPVITNEKDQHYNGFRYESEPQSDTPILNERQDQEKRNSFDLTGLTFTGNEPERVYAAPQEILITDDSRRSTPKKRIKSVPRASSDYRFPSPSIESRIQTTLPPSDDPIVSDIKFVSPVDPNYLIDDIRNSEPSLLDQPAPTEPSFVDLTPKEVTPSLPPLHEVLAHQIHLKRLDSEVEMSRRSSVHGNLEDKPLLESSLLTAEVDDILDSVWPLPPRTFPSLGWTEHILPSSSYYYSHAATRTVTDIDLRDEKKLAAVKAYLKSKHSSTSGQDEDNPNGNDDTTIRNIKAQSVMRIEEGIDLWLRDANQGLPAKKSSEWEFMPMRNWVLHATRAVTFDPPSEYHATEDLSDEDRLDLENRYWQYMSTHPAHASLPQTAYDEAVEILTWCYADRVLRTPQPLPVPLPFTQKECIDLLELLRNVTASSTSTSTHVVRTRLISQILLRYTEWRQKYVTKSAPDKRGNTLSGRPMEVEHAVPFRQTFHRFIKAVLCLGIPYLFEAQDSDRGGWISDRPTDEEEQGPPNSPRPGDALLGNGQPLVAALLLSASVTMLALPDLDKTSRVAALISALCSASSMVSFVITLHERQNRRTLTTSARQTNTILTSLPLVMLAYSLCAFVVGVIAYAISGGITSNRAGGFGKYTGWIVIAVWIALVAVLASSSALTKRGQ